MGSPLVSYFSRAILNVTQGPNMAAIEKANFGPDYYLDSDSINQDNHGLTTYNFGGLFIIIGSVTLIALFCSLTSTGQKCTQMATSFVHWFYTFLTFNGSESRVHCNDANGESSPEEVNNVPPGEIIVGEVLETRNDAPIVSATQDEVPDSNPPTNASSIPVGTSEAHQPEVSTEA